MSQPTQQSGNVNTALAQQQPSAALMVRDLLSKDSYKRRFEEVLRDKAAPFLASITQAAQSYALSKCEPKSIIAAAFTAATLDLPIDKNLGIAHLVPYKGVAQFQMGYKGFIQLALRTGVYRSINDAIIYEGELVSYDELFGELKIDRSKRKSDKVIGYAATFKLLNGFEKVVYWPVERVRAHAKRFSKAIGKADSPWNTNFDAMALKTVIKAMLSKYGVLSVQMQKALVHDQGSQKDIDAEVKYDDSTTVDLDATSVADGDDKPDAPEAGISSALKPKADATEPTSAVEKELDAQTPPPAQDDGTRAKIVDELKNLMLDHNVTELNLFLYAKRTKLVPEGVDELFALPTDTLAKLKFAVPTAAVKGGAK
jgi:recombination protein RecT